MKLGFLELRPDERRLYLEQAATRRNVSAVVLEKDFWVCWILGVLFGSEFAGAIVFKGGTSLSKVFGVIDRFSEDIDLSLSPAFLELPEAGARDGGWIEFLTDPGTNSPVLLFHYPSTQPAGFAYLERSVKLEFGSLTDQQPVGRHAVRPWVAETLPTAFPDWRCEVVALEVERSFWEKATILHAECHRPAEKPMPDRFSRHFADTAALARHPDARRAIDEQELRRRVVAWKGQFFGSAWARYDLAKPGTFRLVPPVERLPALRRDYQAMRDMYLSEPTAFDEVLDVLTELEQRINESVEG